MSTATKIRKLTDWKGDAALYRLDPPLEGNEYVVVSAADMRGRSSFFDMPEVMKIETYIFGATEDGEVADYMELPGSMKGTLDHAEALRDAGYEIQS